MIVLNSIVPVFALIVLGRILGRIKFLKDDVFKANDRLVYYILFPALLFWKVGDADPGNTLKWPLISVVVGILFSAYIISILYIRLSGMPRKMAGAFSQCCYRFNTFVGLAVILSILGDEGIKQFGVLISIVIPVLNVMAVSTLIWYSESSYSLDQKVRLFIKELIANPLIIGCLSGLLFSFTGFQFPVFMSKSFQLLTSATLPLALLSVGNSLTFDNIKDYFSGALVCSIIKNAYIPIAGYVALTVFEIHGIQFLVAMVFFAMPTSVAAYILSSQLNSDPDMASACIVSSTISSFFSLSAVVMISHQGII